MPYENMTAEELIQHVWVTAEERTPLEIVLAEVITQMIDEHEGGFGEHD